MAHPDLTESGFIENALVLTIKTPIMTAADDKFCDILPNFRKN